MTQSAATQLPPPRKIQRYGWKPDLPDFRDMRARQFMAETPLKPVPANLRKFSLRPDDPEPPYDQLQLGSCTGNGIAYAVQFRRKAQGLAPFRPSRLFIYYWERYLENTVNDDSGAMIRDGIKVVNKYGAPPEDGWPYDISKFTQEPPAAEISAGETAQVLKYASVDLAVDLIKQFIYNGYPVVKGFTVFDSFESDAVAKTGSMPVPQSSEQQLGGHCTAWMGWDDDRPVPNATNPGALEDRNSWNTNWADGGYFWYPYQCLNIASDAWVVEVVESQAASAAA